MRLAIFVLLSMTLRVSQALDQHEIRMGVKMDQRAFQMLGGKRDIAEIKVKEVMSLANRAIRGAKAVIVVADYSLIPESDNPVPWNTLQDNLIGVRKFAPSRPQVDFFQLWTGKGFHQQSGVHWIRMNFAAARDTVCDVKASALISIVNEKGDVYPAPILAHFVLKALTVNMGMNQSTLTCPCSTEDCVTDTGSTSPGRYYTHFPPCAPRFMDKRFEYAVCTSARSSGSYPRGLGICGNGFREDVEVCDCRLGNTTCEACCIADRCEEDTACDRPISIRDPNVPAATAATAGPVIVTKATPAPVAEWIPDDSDLPLPPLPPITPRAPIPTPIVATSPSTTTASTSTSTSTTTTMASITDKATTPTPPPPVVSEVETNGNSTTKKGEVRHFDAIPVAIGVVVLSLFLLGVTVFVVMSRRRRTRKRRPKPFTPHLSTAYASPSHPMMYSPVIPPTPAFPPTGRRKRQRNRR